MTETLHDVLIERLSATPVTLEGFRAIVTRLYAMGTLMRDESSSEGRLYDDAVRVEPILHEYFGLLGFRLVHTSQFNYFRLYPPGMAVEGEEGEAVRRLRHRLTKDFAAMVLALRHLYTNARDAGDLNELGECPVSLEEINTTLATLLRMEKPGQKQARLDIYRELRVQKIARFPQNFEGETADTMLSIRPGVLDFVSDAQLLAVRAEAEARRRAEEPAPVTALAASFVDSEMAEPTGASMSESGLS